METEFKKLLLTYAAFTEEELELILSFFKPVMVKKNQFILNQGSVSKAYYYIYIGGIRTFFIDRKGGEKTRYVMLENGLGTTLSSFVNQKPSLEFIQAIDDTQLLAISRDKFYELVEKIDAWKIFYTKILEDAYTYQNKKIESLVTLTANQRYHQLLTERPEYVQRLSNKMLASYLDMREETLSRLKSM